MTERNQTLARLSQTQLERFLVELANIQVDPIAIRRFQERFAVLIPPVAHDYLRHAGIFQEYSAFDDLLPDEGEEEANEQRYSAFDAQPRGKKFTAAYIESMNKIDREQIRTSFDTYPKFRLSNDETEREQAEGIAWILALSNMLRNLWTEPDLRQKEWGVFAFRYALYKYGDDALTNSKLFGILHDPAMSFRIPPPTPFEQALSYLVKVGDKARYCANSECPAPYFFVKRKNQRYCSEICAGPAQRELKRQWWAEHGEEWRAARQEKKPSKRRANKGKSSRVSKRTSKKERTGK